MRAPIPFTDDGGTRAWRANQATFQPAPWRFPLWRVALIMLALPFLLAFLAAATWFLWTVLQGSFGTWVAVAALAGVAAVTGLLKRRAGMSVGGALIFVAAAGFVGLVWVVLGLVVWALVVG